MKRKTISGGQKRALGFTSLSQPCQRNRPLSAPSQEERDGGSSVTLDDVRRLIREELKRVQSHSPEYGQREERDGRSSLTLDDVRRLFREELERVPSHWPEYGQSCTGTAHEDIVQQMRSLENVVWELKEKVEVAVHSTDLRRARGESMAYDDTRNLQLQFRTRLSLPIFTKNKLEGEGGNRISVALVDVSTGEIIKSGPLSSIELEVVVLEGNFNKRKKDHWAQEEFENHVVEPRDGKQPILIGDDRVTLKGGEGMLGQLIITDNSRWNGSKKFRLGLKVAPDYRGDTRIQEAITDAFTVSEKRTEAQRKSYPPKPNDDLWRLQKIAKSGIVHKKLEAARIEKVEDFLLQYFTDPDKLREILGTSIIELNWKPLIRHAITCKINRLLYLYYPPSTRKDGALFDTDDQLIGLIKDRVYVSTRQLSAQEKEHGDTIVKMAFDNWNDVMEFNGETFSPIRSKKSSSSLTPQVCAAPQALVPNEGLTAEGQSQYNTFENAMEFPADESVLPAAHPLSTYQNANFGAMDTSVDNSVPLQPICAGQNFFPVDESVLPTAHPPMSAAQNDDFIFGNISFGEGVPLDSHEPTSADENANFGNTPIPEDSLTYLFSPGDNGITSAGVPTQSHHTNLQHAMGNQMIGPCTPGYIVNEDVLPSGRTSSSTFQDNSTSFLSEGNYAPEHFQSTMADDDGDISMYFQDSFWEGPFL